MNEDLMPQPKTHGILNYCPVNVCLPEIMKGIHYFAHKEAKKPVDEKTTANYEAHREGYTLLKKTFQEFYNLGTITWSQFYRIITEQVDNNNTLAQIIMGPVSEKFANNELQIDKRYRPLTMEETSKRLLRPLGIEVHEHSYNNKNELFEEKTYAVPSKVAVVDVFNSGTRQHWERGTGPIADVQNDAKDLSKESHDLYISFGDPDQVKNAFEKLKQKVYVLAENTDTVVFNQSKFVDDLRKTNLDFKGTQIATKDVANVKVAEAGESDENFAKRLQEAELRKYDEEVKKSGPRR